MAGKKVSDFLIKPKQSQEKSKSPDRPQPFAERKNPIAERKNPIAERESSEPPALETPKEEELEHLPLLELEEEATHSLDKDLETSSFKDLDEEEVDEPASSKKPSRRARKKSQRKKKKPQTRTAEQEYRAYKLRKLGIYIGFFVVVAVFCLGIAYMAFFKETLTEKEAAAYTNAQNQQGSVTQRWDSAVLGFLEKNAQELFQKSFIANKVAKDFKVKDIRVERNLTVSDDCFLTFFSARIAVGEDEDEVFCSIPLIASASGLEFGGELSISTRSSYSGNARTAKENPLLDFASDSLDDAANVQDLKKALENFFTLGYNARQDVSNIYKGDARLEFHGKFVSVDKCELSKIDNSLGCNCKVKYVIELSNSAKYTVVSYMKVHKEGQTYIIDKII